METCSRYMNNKYLILILYYLKFLKEPNIFQSLIWRILSRVKPIINHTLPMTLWKLRGFLGITGYCHIWIPGYGELAQPLYKLITETQQAQTTSWFGLQILKAFNLFKLLFSRLLFWPCLQDESLVCYWKKKICHLHFYFFLPPGDLWPAYGG